MDTYLQTERLALRRFTTDDAELLIELDSDPAVMRYLTGGEPTAPEVVRERHLPNILAGYDTWHGNFGLFAAHEKDSGTFLGWFLLRPKPGGPLDEVELGYRLRYGGATPHPQCGTGVRGRVGARLKVRHWCPAGADQVGLELSDHRA